MEHEHQSEIQHQNTCTTFSAFIAWWIFFTMKLRRRRLSKHVYSYVGVGSIGHQEGEAPAQRVLTPQGAGTKKCHGGEAKFSSGRPRRPRNFMDSYNCFASKNIFFQLWRPDSRGRQQYCTRKGEGGRFFNRQGKPPRARMSEVLDCCNTQK